MHEHVPAPGRARRAANRILDIGTIPPRPYWPASRRRRSTSRPEPAVGRHDPPSADTTAAISRAVPHRPHDRLDGSVAPTPPTDVPTSMVSDCGDAFSTMTASADSVRDFVTAHRDDLLADLDAWLRIPGISAQPEHHADVARSAEWLADGVPPDRLPDRRGLADRRPAGGVRRVAQRRRRRADRARLRPSRRPAGRPARAVAHRPVRPDRRRRSCCAPAAPPTTRASCCSTCSALRAHLAATGRTQPGGHAEVPDRGRGGVRLAELRGSCCASTATGSTATSSSSPTPA